MSDEIGRALGHASATGAVVHGSAGNHVHPDRRQRPRRPGRHLAPAATADPSGGRSDGAWRSPASGAITPVGNDAPSTWSALVAGPSGIGPITTFDATTFPVRIAGMVEDFDARRTISPTGGSRVTSRAPPAFGVAAAVQALADAGDRRRNLRTGRARHRDGRQRRPGRAAGAGRHVAPHREHRTATSCYRQSPGNVLLRDQNIGAGADRALVGNCQGPMISVSTACTGSAHALGEAFRRIQDGDAQADGRRRLRRADDLARRARLLAARGARRPTTTTIPSMASRPFDETRSGLRARRGRGRGDPRGLGGGARRAGRPDPRRDRRLRLEPERLPDDRPAAGRRRRDPGDARTRWRSPALAHERRRLRRRPRHRHARQRPVRDAWRIKAVFGRRRLPPGDQLAEVDDRAPHVGRRGAQPAGRRLRHPGRGRAADDQPGPPRPEAGPGLRAERRPAGWRCRAAMVNAFAFGGTNASLVVRAPATSGAGAGGDAWAAGPTRRPRHRASSRARARRRSATSRTPSRSSTATSPASRCCPAC